MSVEMVTEAEDFEARCRKAMARVPKARGWDTARIRDDELAWLDILFDGYNEAVRDGR